MYLINFWLHFPVVRDILCIMSILSPFLRVFLLPRIWCVLLSVCGPLKIMYILLFLCGVVHKSPLEPLDRWCCWILHPWICGFLSYANIFSAIISSNTSFQSFQFLFSIWHEHHIYFFNNIPDPWGSIHFYFQIE